MNILSILALAPDLHEFYHERYVDHRLKNLKRLKDVGLNVVAPVPKFPLIHKINDRYKFFASIPDTGMIGGVTVYHPKYNKIPGLNIPNQVTSISSVSNGIVEELNPDIIDAQNIYPDGVAAYDIARVHQKPLVLTASGLDVSYWLEQKNKKHQIIGALEYASHVICKSDDLKHSLLEHGIDGKKLTTIIHGVDPDNFNTTVEKNPLREEYFLCVGDLYAHNGNHITLNALSELLRRRLIVAGDGDQKHALKNQAASLGISGRVQFIKQIETKKLAQLYAGATATIIMSDIGDVPPELLESLATGTPVIIPTNENIDKIINPSNGITINNPDEFELIDAIENIEKLKFSRAVISKTVEKYRWDDVVQKQYDIYDTAITTFKKTN